MWKKIADIVRGGNRKLIHLYLHEVVNDFGQVLWEHVIDRVWIRGEYTHVVDDNFGQVL